MKARRHLSFAKDPGEPVLGYEAALPHLTLPSGASPRWTTAPAAGRSRGLVSSPVVLGAVLGLGTTSMVLLALLA